MYKLDWIHYLLYFLIGAISGVSMGIVGVGAGMITIPLLLYSGLTIKQSVGISLIMQLLPQSLPGVLMYYKGGTITLAVLIISLFVVFGSLVGIYIGAYIVNNNLIDLQTIYGLLSGLLIFSGFYIIYEHVLYNDPNLI
jgi:uncharacterized membrane protein YfcA